MRTRNQTTVVLTEVSQKVKEDLAPIFGLKNILSAGLVLLSKLSDSEQKAVITEANGAGVDKDLGPLLSTIAEAFRQDRAGVRLLSKAESAQLDGLRKLLDANERAADHAG